LWASAAPIPVEAPMIIATGRPARAEIFFFTELGTGSPRFLMAGRNAPLPRLWYTLPVSLGTLPAAERDNSLIPTFPTATFPALPGRIRPGAKRSRSNDAPGPACWTRTGQLSDAPDVTDREAKAAHRQRYAELRWSPVTSSHLSTEVFDTFQARAQCRVNITAHRGGPWQHRPFSAADHLPHIC